MHVYGFPYVFVVHFSVAFFMLLSFFSSYIIRLPLLKIELDVKNFHLYTNNRCFSMILNAFHWVLCKGNVIHGINFCSTHGNYYAFGRIIDIHQQEKMLKDILVLSKKLILEVSLLFSNISLSSDLPPFLYKIKYIFCLFSTSKQNCLNNMENSIVCKCHAFWTMKWDFDENYLIWIKESNAIWIDEACNDHKNIIKRISNFDKKPKISMNFKCYCVKSHRKRFNFVCICLNPSDI